MEYFFWNTFISSEIQFGFWYVYDEGYAHDLPNQHPQELQQKPDSILPSNQRENNILLISLIQTISKLNHKMGLWVSPHAVLLPADPRVDGSNPKMVD